MKKILITVSLVGSTLLSIAQSFNQKYLKDSMYFFDDLVKIKQSELFTVHKAEFGLGISDSMSATNNIVDSNGHFKTKYVLYNKGILVEGSQMNVLGEMGIAFYANGFLRTGLNVNTSGLISVTQAIDSAIAYVGANLYPWQDSTLESELKIESGDSSATNFPSNAELIITKKRGDQYDHSIENYQLCYKVTIDALNPRSKTDVFVNANTGQIFTSQDAWTHDYTRTGTGWTWYNGWYNNLKTRSCGTCFNYWLHDVDRNIYTTKFEKSYWQKGSYNKDNNNDWVENDTKTAATLHWGLERSWDYFLYRHGRSGSNYHGKRVHAITNGYDYFQAGFASTVDEDQIAVCEDGVLSGAYSPGNPGYSIATLDVIGHEYTHAMVKASSALGVLGDFDAKALNEGYADIFGNKIKRFALGTTNWDIFEGIGSYKRSLNDPHNDKPYKSPEKYLEPSFWSSTDFHANGGVIRKWFYLIANGGTFNGHTINSLGIEKADDIAYTTFNWWLWSNVRYQEAAQQTVNATIANWGKCSNEHRQVVNAMRAVGFSIANILCANIEIEGPRVVNTTLASGPIAWTGILREVEDGSGTYDWHIPFGWNAVATNNTLTLNSTSNTSSQKLWVTYTAGNFSTTDTLVIHFSDEVWTPTPPPTPPQLRRTNEEANEEILVNSSFNVFPNPAQNVIYINAPKCDESYLVSIYDFSGRKINEFNFNGTNTAIEVSKWPVGIYMLKINSNQYSHTEKITINH